MGGGAPRQARWGLETLKEENASSVSDLKGGRDEGLGREKERGNNLNGGGEQEADQRTQT